MSRYSTCMYHCNYMYVYVCVCVCELCVCVCVSVGRGRTFVDALHRSGNSGCKRNLSAEKEIRTAKFQVPQKPSKRSNICLAEMVLYNELTELRKCTARFPCIGACSDDWEWSKVIQEMRKDQQRVDAQGAPASTLAANMRIHHAFVDCRYICTFFIGFWCNSRQGLKADVFCRMWTHEAEKCLLRMDSFGIWFRFQSLESFN